MTELTLLANDWLEVKRWFEKQRGSKVIVLSGFGVVMLITMLAAFSLSFFYFRNLAGFGIYGVATAAYLLHAAILVTGLLATGSATASTLAFLLKGSKSTDYLQSLPLGKGVLVRWFMIKSATISALLLALFMIPVFIAYAAGMRAVLTPLYVIRVVVLLGVLVSSCQSLGSILAFVAAPYLRGKTTAVFFASGIGMIVMMFLLLKLIFPITLSQLYFARADQFWNIYYALPLSNTYLPTLWMTMLVVTNDLGPLLVSMGVAAVLLVCSYYYQKSRYVSLYQLIHGAPYQHRPSRYTKPVLFRRSEPLLMKDFLSILRTPSEISYILFLVGLASFFFLLIIYAGSFRYIRGRLWGPGLISFSLGWLLFFTTAFLLRLVFPLMAREKNQAWFLFAQPISSARIVMAKLMASMALGAVFILFAVSLWMMTPISIIEKILLVTWSIWGILLLTIIHATFGMTRPNFEAGADPERVSTSGQGITALAASMLVIAAVCYGLFQYLSYGSIPMWLLVVFLFMSAGLPLYLLKKAYGAVKLYEF